MTRPGRQFEGIRRVVRRRHRTWMASMTLATMGWALIWIALCLARWAPEWAPTPEWSFNLASFFGVLGIGLGVFTLRAKLAWILITAAPLFANASLLSLRLVVPDLLDQRSPVEEEARGPELEGEISLRSGCSRAA